MSGKDTELLPCPFCGGKAKLIINMQAFEPFVMVRCENCGAKTKKIMQSVDYCAADEAVKIWNRRAIPDEVVSEVENAFIAVDEQLSNILNELRRKVEAGDFKEVIRNIIEELYAREDNNEETVHIPADSDPA